MAIDDTCALFENKLVLWSSKKNFEFMKADLLLKSLNEVDHPKNISTIEEMIKQVGRAKVVVGDTNDLASKLQIELKK